LTLERPSLSEIAQRRILVFDGAMGTTLQEKNLSEEDFGGPQFDGCNEQLVITRPETIADVHRAFLDAGADIVETDTFGATSIVLAEYGLQDQAFEINRAAASLARKAADEFSSPARPRFVAGSMGPTTKSITVTGGVTFFELIETYAEQARGLIAGGVDALLLETCQDTRNVKAGILAINQAREESGTNLPLMISGTIEPMGAMLAGQSVEALYASVEHARPLSIGLNCATGPRFMTDHIRSLAQIARCGVACVPNAGLPDEEGRYGETPEMMVRVLRHFVDEGWVNFLGGCCGTTSEHIRAIAEMVQGRRPRDPGVPVRCHVSGIDYLEMTDEKRPMLVGERTNVIGSRKFKRLIAEGAIEEAAEIGRKQVRSGAHIVDVCLANPDRDERADMQIFLEQLIKKVRAPLMIDSTDPAVIECALQYAQGKSIINSINLEDGEERFAQVVPIARTYGAALIVGCIDEDPEQGMGVTVERKVGIAQRAFRLLTEKYGVPPQDIIIDPLVFPCGTGDENYVGSAAQTIQGVAAVKAALPEVKTLLGVSNVSFGLPPAGREVLNAVFLYHCTKAGLDLAIVNAEKLERYASILEQERRLAEDLLFNRGDDPLGAFVEYFRDKKPEQKAQPRSDRTLEERLAACIVEATKEGLVEDLDLALQTDRPLDLINGPLMAGMEEVGRLFGNNELIVAEVLQSAEVMKAAVAHLEPLMEKSETSVRGKVLLATVKGDVHDIGKNLVDMIFSNNGFRIINLGIKIPPQTIIDAVEKHQPDLIGLSGLLVKSAQQMVVTADDLREAGIQTPLLVGGAALTDKFTRLKIAAKYEGMVAYAADAMIGLELAGRIVNSEQRAGLQRTLQDKTAQMKAKIASSEESVAESAQSRKRILPRQDVDIPSPPDLKRHVLTDYPLEEVFPYVNPHMLLGKHLGLKGPVKRLLAEKNEKALAMQKQVRRMEDFVIEKRILKPRAVFQFFPARPEGDTIVILHSDRKREIERLAFPRQSGGAGLCLSDFLVADRNDALALFVVTVADETLYHWSDRFRQEGELLKSHLLQALALECAEALAERLHEKIRQMWGIADAPSMPLEEKFQARYRGIRVSFGYPACPRLEDQSKLFGLLKAEEAIGVQLTEGYMMEPEASVSAMVFHHPDARYFSVSEQDLQGFEERQIE